MKFNNKSTLLLIVSIFIWLVFFIIIIIDIKDNKTYFTIIECFLFLIGWGTLEYYVKIKKNNY